MDGVFRLNAKYLFLTYPKLDIDKVLMFEELSKKLKISYIMIAKESHLDGTKHMHAYVQLEVKCDIKSSKKLDINGFHGNYKAALGSFDENKAYLTKEDPCVFESGTPIKTDKSSLIKMGLKEKNAKILNTPLQECVTDGLISLERYLSVKKAKEQFLMDQKIVGQRIVNREFFWLHGEPGVGKSRWVRDNHPVFYNKPLSKWWDGYKGESVVVLDDFDKMGREMYHYIKIWADVYSFYGEFKGGMLVCDYVTFVVTSNYLPEEIFGVDDDKLIGSIRRRFKFIHLKNLVALDV